MRGSYDMFDGETKVGSLDVALIKAFPVAGYPGCPDAWNGKPVLEIEGIGVFGLENAGHGRGYGRFGLQACYKLAQNLSEGRMVVHAIWKAGPFYEHCGFRGLHAGEEGIKYFEPTQKALCALFPKGKEMPPTFTIKKRPRENFQFDFELFNKMQNDGNDGN